MKTKHIIVVDYDTNWKSAFIDIKDELLRTLEGHIISIEHVGSTSIPNCPAKPIIDIDIVIHGNFEIVKSLLSTMGYIHEGDLDIKGREAFKYQGKEHLMKHHLYVLEDDALELKKHLTLKEHLAKHPDDLIIYGTLKKELAKKFPHDSESYVNGKSSFIQEIYKIYHLI